MLLTASRMLPNYDEFVGLSSTHAWASDRWWVALKNLGLFSTLYVGGSIAVGLFLAILLDQRVRAEGLPPHRLPVSDGAVALS